MKKRTSLLALAAFALVGCSNYGGEISADKFAERRKAIEDADVKVEELDGYSLVTEVNDYAKGKFTKYEVKSVKESGNFMIKTFNSTKGANGNVTNSGNAIYSVTSGDTYTLASANLGDNEEITGGTYISLQSSLVSMIATQISGAKATIDKVLSSVFELISFDAIDEAVGDPEGYFEFSGTNFESSVKYYSKDAKSAAVKFTANAKTSENKKFEAESLISWANYLPSELSYCTKIDGEKLDEMSIKLETKTPSISLPDLSKLRSEGSAK